MTISYNWLSEYLPEKIEPEKLSKILTSLGLEVESLEKYESVKGGLEGLVIGEVTECTKHPDADKLSLTKVNVGKETLQIVCGAPNVAIRQKVVVAVPGTTIYPTKGEPFTIKDAKIRGVQSQGMICAEDEIGLGESHAGIMVLDGNVTIGTLAADYFKPYTDYVYEIGLTPNRMDAMSHIGTAKDVCAWLTMHMKKASPKLPYQNNFKADKPADGSKIEVIIEATQACKRYAGIAIKGVVVKSSPKWLQDKLKAIGQRPINNIVDITNFILHESGQPLHAFDAAKIKGNKVILKCLEEGTLFTTLDDKERKLSSEDLMICSADEPMCIAGVYGGKYSGVTEATTQVFLESAWFNPVSIRRTSVRHGLRTDAATRFEKGVDISNCVNVLKRAVLLIKEVAGGEIIGDVIDVYPVKAEKKELPIKYQYLKKLSGKNYHPDTVKNILRSLGFELIKDSNDELWVTVPFSKTDITHAADLVEEIMRIDGYDHVDIPQTITLAPANDLLAGADVWKEKVANYLTGLGFHEIFTNSITNSKYYSEEILQQSVKMINSLSSELDVLRPSMLETGLESITYNLKRKNSNLQFFEFGKTYSQREIGKYDEPQHVCLYTTGNISTNGWQQKATPAGLFYLKGAVQQLAALCGVQQFMLEADANAANVYTILLDSKPAGTIGSISKQRLEQFEIKQPVFYADLNWDVVLKMALQQKIVFKEISKFPAVERDLAIVVDKNIAYGKIEAAIQKAGVEKLTGTHLFDVFESEKLGPGKKSVAINFTFGDEERTMTEKEIEKMMQRIIISLENETGAEIRN
jgi:phenylalanyl-tRNA synthetase beta chain